MFKAINGTIVVDSYALEVYLPADYASKAYRGYEYYTLLGDTVRYFGVGNMREYKNKEEMNNPTSIKTYTLGIPMMITSKPSEIDTREVQFTRSGPRRKCIVLTFYKNDIFMTTQDCIKDANNAMIVLGRIEGGKLDHVSPEEALGILQDVQSLNKVNLRISTEAEEIFIAERYRDGNNIEQKARFNDRANSDNLVSLNMRQEAMKSTTYQAITHEDINTSLIVSANRDDDGIRDEPTVVERIVRGLDMSDIINKSREDKDKT